MQPKEGDCMGELLCILGVALILGLFIAYISWYKQNMNNPKRTHTVTHYEDNALEELMQEDEQTTEDEEDEEEDEDEDKEYY